MIVIIHTPRHTPTYISKFILVNVVIYIYIYIHISYYVHNIVHMYTSCHNHITLLKQNTASAPRGLRCAAARPAAPAASAVAIAATGLNILISYSL